MTTYPKWVYHKEHAPEGLFIHRAEDEPAGEGWVSTPAAFDPTYVPPPPLTDDAQFDFLARGGRPFVAFPAWRYHASGDAKLVATAEEDDKLDKSEWKDSPAAFAAPTPSTPPVNATPPPVHQLPGSIRPVAKVKDKE